MQGRHPTCGVEVVSSRKNFWLTCKGVQPREIKGLRVKRTVKQGGNHPESRNENAGRQRQSVPSVFYNLADATREGWGGLVER